MDLVIETKDRRETFSECKCGSQVVVWTDNMGWVCARCSRPRRNAR